MSSSQDRPAPGDCSPYFFQYIERLEEDADVLEALEEQTALVHGALGGLPEERWGYRYAPGKWSVREVLGHLIDCERVFVQRALWFARGGEGELPGFSEDSFVEAAGFDARPMGALLEEYDAQRAASLTFFGGLTDAQLARRGVANGSEIVVRAFPWILAGHELHHLDVLRERYEVE